MNKIELKLSQLKEAGRKALITYMTSGDGGYAMTENCVAAMEASGADMVILGVPFSDPIAEGAAIQKASKRSLDGGTDLMGIFEMIGRIREKTDMPIIMMMYLNTIYRYGKEKFFALCKQYGADGVIVPDMPYEEKGEIEDAANAEDILIVPVAAPASEKRIAMIAENAKGFLYCLPPRYTAETAAKCADFLACAKKYASVPVIADCDSAGAEAAGALAGCCDGLAVCSMIMGKMEQFGADAVPEIGTLTAQLRAQV